MEGVAFAIRAHVEGLGAASTPATEMRVSGRPASLRTWNHIKADVLGIPVSRVAGDATTSGVAMLAGIGVGIYPDAAAAIADRVPARSADRARYGQSRQIHDRSTSTTDDRRLGTLHAGIGRCAASRDRTRPGERA